jgi:WD40 repeat protein
MFVRLRWLVALVCFLLLAGSLIPGVLPAAGADDPPKEENHQTRKDLYGDPLPAGSTARFGTIRLRQPGMLESVAISPDGKLLASCTDDGGARLWDATTGKELRSLPAQRGFPATSVAFHPSGKQLAVAARFTVYLWDLPTGTTDTLELPPKWEIHWGPSAISFSPDGKWFAGGSRDKVLLWDLQKRQLIQTLEGNDDPVQAVRFSPDSKTLAVGGGDFAPEMPTIRLWDLATSKVIQTFVGHKPQLRGAWITCLAFSPDGKTLASSSQDATIRLWDVTKGMEIRRLPGTLLNAVAFAPDGKTLVCGDRATIRFFDPATGKERLKVPSRGGTVQALCFYPDSKTLATVDRSSTIRLWNAATGEPILPADGHTAAVLAVAFAADGKTLATSSEDWTLRAWDVATSRELHRLEDPKSWPIAFGGKYSHLPGHLLAWAPDGQSVAGRLPGQWGSLGLWEPARGESNPLEGAQDVAISPDGQILAAVSPGKIQLYSLDGRRASASYALDVPTPGQRSLYDNRSVAFSSDGRILIAGSVNGMIRLWDWKGKRLILDFPAQEAYVNHLAISPDGALLASCGPSPPRAKPDGTIRLWDAATGVVVQKLEGHNGSVSALAFSPDGRTLASAGEGDNTVRVWDVLTGKELAKFEGHTGAVYSVAFSPDGQTLASGSADTTALLWDIRGLAPTLPATKPTAKEMEKLWEDLKASDGAAAHRSLLTLIGAGESVMPFLKERLHPVPEPDAQRVQRLLADLDSTDFSVREAATQELEKYGGAVEKALRQALEGKPTAEATRRVEPLLAHATELLPTGERLRQRRALRVLERLGSPAAREVLEALGRGASGAALTREAKAALERLKRKPTTPDSPPKK